MLGFIFGLAVGSAASGGGTAPPVPGIPMYMVEDIATRKVDASKLVPCIGGLGDQKTLAQIAERACGKGELIMAIAVPGQGLYLLVQKP